MIYSDAAVQPGTGEFFQADSLGRRGVVLALSRMLGDRGLQTPVTVGILGGWGTGKTSAMRLLEGRLASQVHVLPLWFDAWAYARQEQSLWRALLLKITGELRERAGSLTGEAGITKELLDGIDALEASLYRSLTLEQSNGHRVNWGNAVPLVADVALRWATAGLSDTGKDSVGDGLFARFSKLLSGKDAREAVALIEETSRKTHVAEVRSLEQFRKGFEDALRLAGVGDGPDARRIVIFVDDLDRCLPEDAVAAIEAIKLFLDVPGCVFVLGMDPEVVETGIRARYAKYFAAGTTPFDPADYLDKVIQVPFRLPPLDRAQVAGYLDALAGADPSGVVADVRALVEIAVPDNPRALKRALNVLRLAAELDGAAHAQPAPDAALTRRRRHLAKIVLLQVCFRSAWAIVANGGKAQLLDLEDRAKGRRDHKPEDPALPLRLEAMLAADPLFKDLSDADLNGLLTLARPLTTDLG